MLGFSWFLLCWSDKRQIYEGQPSSSRRWGRSVPLRITPSYRGVGVGSYWWGDLFDWTVDIVTLGLMNLLGLLLRSRIMVGEIVYTSDPASISELWSFMKPKE